MDETCRNETYDVALWKWWPSLGPDYVEDVQAPDALSAIYTLMRLRRLDEVAHAAARVVGRPGIERWDYLLLPDEPSMDEEENEREVRL